VLEWIDKLKIQKAKYNKLQRSMF